MTTTGSPSGSMHPTTAAERVIVAAAALAKHGQDHPTALVSLTDEELIALLGASPDPCLLTPWVDVHAPTDDERGVLAASARRSLLARGVVAPEATMAAAEEREPLGDPKAITATALLSGISGRRQLSQRRVTVEDIAVSDTTDVVALQLFADRDGTVLQEQVTRNGLHHFVISRLEAALPTAIIWMLGVPDSETEFSSARFSGVRSGTLRELRNDTDVAETLAGASRHVRITAEDQADGVSQSLQIIHDGSSILAIERAEDSHEASPDVVSSAALASDIFEETSRVDAVSITARDLARELRRMLSVEALPSEGAESPGQIS